jgi:hypothetical protein
MCTKVSELCKLELVTVDLKTSKEGLISDVTMDKHERIDIRCHCGHVDKMDGLI